VHLRGTPDHPASVWRKGLCEKLVRVCRGSVVVTDDDAVRWRLCLRMAVGRRHVSMSVRALRVYDTIQLCHGSVHGVHSGEIVHPIHPSHSVHPIGDRHGVAAVHCRQLEVLVQQCVVPVRHVLWTLVGTPLHRPRSWKFQCHISIAHHRRQVVDVDVPRQTIRKLGVRSLARTRGPVQVVG